MDNVQKELLKQIAGLHEIPVGHITSEQMEKQRQETAQNISKLSRKREVMVL